MVPMSRAHEKFEQDFNFDFTENAFGAKVIGEVPSSRLCCADCADCADYLIWQKNLDHIQAPAKEAGCFGQSY